MDLRAADVDAVRLTSKPVGFQNDLLSETFEVRLPYPCIKTNGIGDQGFMFFSAVSILSAPNQHDKHLLSLIPSSLVSDFTHIRISRCISWSSIIRWLHLYIILRLLIFDFWDGWPAEENQNILACQPIDGEQNQLHQIQSWHRERHRQASVHPQHVPWPYLSSYPPLRGLATRTSKSSVGKIVSILPMSLQTIKNRMAKGGWCHLRKQILLHERNVKLVKPH